MGEQAGAKKYPVEEAVRAQKALREMAGLGAEMFPVEAFVGMISDEVETLRKQGRSDEEIARKIRDSSKIEISGAEIAANYATPEEARWCAEVTWRSVHRLWGAGLSCIAG